MRKYQKCSSESNEDSTLNTKRDSKKARVMKCNENKDQQIEEIYSIDVATPTFQNHT